MNPDDVGSNARSAVRIVSEGDNADGPSDGDEGHPGGRRDRSRRGAAADGV